MSMYNVLFIGKDLKENNDAIVTIQNTNRKIFTTCNDSTIENSKVSFCSWNKSSIISARTVILNSEIKLHTIDEIIIYFDSLSFSSKYEIDKSENISAAVDNMILSYQLFINELLARLDQKKEKTQIIFLARTLPSKSELNSISSKNISIRATSNIVSASQEAFLSLAQNTASLATERQYLSILLSICNYENELFKNEKELFSWLLTTMDQVHNQKKQNPKQSLSWIKAGSKAFSGFSLFK
jgi:hypothetical protein